MEKINQKSLPERTADGILMMLHLENYSVGQKLPNELKLAERFEVSRSTVRQAEKILKEKGVLEIERGAGTFVSGKLEADDPLGISTVYDKQKLARDLLELRLMIEPKAAALSAKNAKRKDILLLQKLCSELEDLVLHEENYVQKDVEFHQAVINCSGNLALHNLIPYIYQMQLLHDSFSEKRYVETVREHWEITKAIAEGREMDAFNAMEYHLILIRNRLSE